MNYICRIFLLSVFFVVLESAEPYTANPITNSVLKKSGLSGGLCVFPDLKDISLAIDISKKSKWKVYAYSDDDAIVKNLQQKAIAVGILNQKLYIGKKNSVKLPFAKYSVDLIINEQGEKITKDKFDAQIPFLTSRRGRILLNGGSIGKSVGENWKLFQAPTREGGDQWTHRYHSPNNNFFSKDTALRPPFATQWLSTPFHDGYWGTTSLTEGGRYYTFVARFKDRKLHIQTVLRARSQGNGLILWERPLNAANKTTTISKSSKSYDPVFIINQRNCAIKGGLLIADGDGVLELDGETGKELGRISGPVPNGQIRWVSEQDGVIVVLAGSIDVQTGNSGYYLGYKNKDAKHFAAYDLVSKKKLWGVEAEAGVDDRIVSIKNGSLFYYATEKYIAAIDLKTGKELWRQADKKVINKIKDSPFSKKKKRGYTPFSTRIMMSAESGILLFPSRKTGFGVALSQKDGSFLWQQEKLPWFRSSKTVIVDDKIISPRAEFDIKTGKKISSKSHVLSDLCGPFTSTPLLSISGMGAVMMADGSGKKRFGDLKPGCDEPNLVSDGLAISHGSVCDCNGDIFGYRAFGHYEVPIKKVKPVTHKQQEQNIAVQEKLSDAKDWTQLSHDLRRKNATPVSVGKMEPKQIWKWNPLTSTIYRLSLKGSPRRSDMSLGGDFHSSSLVAADDKAWFVDACGVLRCIFTETGKELWNSALSANTKQPPTFWNGRVYVGDNTGLVSCFDATKGNLIWSYFAAPADRRIMSYNILENTWPINSGVLVHKGIVYCVAGFHRSTGVSVSAIEAKTGKLKWNNFVSDKQIRGGGSLTITGNSLWLSSSMPSNIPASFNLQNGSLVQDKKPKYSAVGQLHSSTDGRGKQITAFSDDWLFLAGRRIVDTHSIWNSHSFRFYMQAFSTKDSTLSRLSGFELLKTGTIPAWDDELFITGVPKKKDGPESSIAVLSSPKLLKALNYTQKQYEDNKKLKLKKALIMYPESPLVKSGEFKNFPSEIKVWGPIELPNSGLILTADAILILVASNSEIPEWSLQALSRKDGSVLWNVKLSEQPVFDSLSVDRKGRIFVPLRNGSIVCFSSEIDIK